MADATIPQDVPHEPRLEFEALIEETRARVFAEPHRLKEHVRALAIALQALAK